MNRQGLSQSKPADVKMEATSHAGIIHNRQSDCGLCTAYHIHDNCTDDDSGVQVDLPRLSQMGIQSDYSGVINNEMKYL